MYAIRSYYARDLVGFAQMLGDGLAGAGQHRVADSPSDVEGHLRRCNADHQKLGSGEERPDER